MSKEERAKFLEKIAKCMALGKSSNEHEAAAAMRQAQKLMQIHDISEAEINAVGYTDGLVQTTQQATKKTIPMQISAIMSLMKKAFGVKGVVGSTVLRTDANIHIRYFGHESRVPMACHVHTVIARAMETSWNEYIRANPLAKGQRGAKATFQTGWVRAVAEKVEAIGFTQEENAIEVAQNSFYGKELKKAGSGIKSTGMNLAGAGAAASSGFNIHRPMNVNRKVIGN